MFKLIKLLLLIGVIAIGWWLLSPLFIDKKVDEDFDPKVASALNLVIEKAGEGLQNAGEKISETNAEGLKKKIAELKISMGSGTNLSKQIKDTDAMNVFMDEMSKMGDKEVKEDFAVSENQSTLLKGSFASVAYKGTGDVRVIYLGVGTGTIVRLENLDIINGPDLHVVLSKSSDVEKSGHLGEYIELGNLKGNKGNQNYVVPIGVDASAYNSVVIYSKAFSVVFNSANLAK